MEFEDKLAKLLQISGLLEFSNDAVLEEEHQENVSLHASEDTAIDESEINMISGNDLIRTSSAHPTEEQRLHEDETEVAAKTVALVKSANNIDYGDSNDSTSIVLVLAQNNGTEDRFLSFETGLENDVENDVENCTLNPETGLLEPPPLQTGREEQPNDDVENYVLNPETGLLEPDPLQTGREEQPNDDVENYVLNPETGLLEPDPLQTGREVLHHLINPVTGVLEEVKDLQESESANDLKIGKKRKRNPTKWEKNKKIKNNLKDHEMRPIPNCRCKCKEKMNDNECRTLFSSFINLSSHTEQNIYLQGCLLDAVPKRYRPRKTKMSSKEAKNRRVFKYCVSVGNKSIIVCQQAFLAIHGIKRDRLKRKIQHKEKDIQDGRGRHANHPTCDSNTMDKIHEFLNYIPSRESHYSRSSNKHRKFLDSNLTIALLHRKFLTDYPENPITYEKFREVFNTDYCYSFRQPRKDICHTCEKLKVNIDAAEANNNEEEKTRLQKEKELHLRKAEVFLERLTKAEKEKDASKLALCIDFQKNLPLPVTNVGDEYYLRQLWMHNFGIHNLTDNTATMYLYTENYALKGPNEVISALSDFIDTNKKPTQTKLEIYCDNCYGQNKNKYVFAFLDNLCALGKFETASIYFPIPGHSMMPIDRDFALIERKRIKCEKIYTPVSYIEMIINCKNTNKFNIVFLQRNLSENSAARVVQVQDYKRLFTGRVRASIPGISTCRQVMFRKNGKPEMTQSMTSENLNRFALYRTGVSRILREMPVNCYDGQIKLKEAKVRDIKKLLEYVPEHLRNFYTEIIESNEYGDHAAEDVADEME